MDETGLAGAVEDWETRPFAGGYRGLQDLADESFSGAIEANDTWLLMINGRCVGVFDEYETAGGYAQEPADIERFDGVDGTAYEAPAIGLPLLYAMLVSDGEVVETGYTEERPISEVHRELDEAQFVGYLELSEQVLSGDYYVVYQGGRSMTVAFTGPSRRLRTGEEAFDRACEEVGLFEVNAIPIEIIDIPEPSDAGGSAHGVVAGTGAAGSQSGPDPAPGPDTVESEPGFDDSLDRVEPSKTGTQPEEMEDEDGAAADTGSGDSEPTDEATATDPTPPLDAEPPSESDPNADRLDEPGAQSPGDPDDLGTGEPEQPPSADSTAAAGPLDAERGEPTSPAVQELESRLETLATEQERLSATVRELEQRVDGLVGSSSTPFEADRTLTPSEALDETTLLVHYESGSGPTLDTVHDGAGDREALADNLQLDHQTPFPAARTAVDDVPYRSFLTGTIEYRFVDWMLTELPFDLRSSSIHSKLTALFDVFPRVARAEFGGNATVEGTAFDIVLRTREGEPLVVAEIADTSKPPTESTTNDFIRAASEAGEAKDSLAGAFLVTTSFVDAESVNPVREATRSRLLARNKRRSFVSLPSGGFHLCLVEGGGDSFHVAVPEL